MVRGLFFKLGYPLLLIFGWVFRIRKDKVQRFLIDVNNRLVRRSKRSPAKRLLLLLPHCLQRSECNIKITFNIFNCEGCGKCEIKDFVEIAKAHGQDLFIAT
ncbi:MAG TPA: DUF116 domain-containing protein, partial [Nitrospirae bacterium]|nr:DUF116 domain-containing protein [Nitrospirota bacterium]